MTEVLHLVDGHGIGHRAYHAANGRGWLQAIRIFASQLDSLERRHQPRRAVVVFDVAAKNWRHDLYPKYKADRPRPEVELCKAMPRWKPLARAAGWPAVSVRGYEADDVIATLATWARAAGWDCVIHASDKDLHALVDEHVRQVTGAGAELGPAEVESKLGVPPARVADYLALLGDKSDGVPGVPGCGEKNAVRLCRRYPSIEAVIAANPKLCGKYPLGSGDGADVLRLSRRLVELVRTVDLDVDLARLVLGRRDEADVRMLLGEPRPPAPPLPTFTGGRPPPHRQGYTPPARLSPEAEYIEERAAIAEVDGGLSPDDAERSAREQLARRSA